MCETDQNLKGEGDADLRDGYIAIIILQSFVYLHLDPHL
jgi:hypothetical protein